MAARVTPIFELVQHRIINISFTPYFPFFYFYLFYIFNFVLYRFLFLFIFLYLFDFFTSPFFVFFLSQFLSPLPFYVFCVFFPFCFTIYSNYLSFYLIDKEDTKQGDKWFIRHVVSVLINTMALF